MSADGPGSNQRQTNPIATHPGGLWLASSFGWLCLNLLSVGRTGDTLWLPVNDGHLPKIGGSTPENATPNAQVASTSSGAKSPTAELSGQTLSLRLIAFSGALDASLHALGSFAAFVGKLAFRTRQQFLSSQAMLRVKNAALTTRWLVSEVLVAGLNETMMRPETRLQLMVRPKIREPRPGHRLNMRYPARSPPEHLTMSREESL